MSTSSPTSTLATQTARAALGPAAGTHAAHRHRDWLVILAASLLATIPVWIPTFPPMADLPQHAAQIGLLQGMLQESSFPYASAFRLNWFTPYLLGYLLVYGLAQIVGVVLACKTVIALALAAIPMATALLMTETGTDRRWALLAIPAMYGFTYHWGFLNFLVATPVGLLFLWLVLRHAKRPTTSGGVLVGVAIVALFFCHALICLFFGGIAGCILLMNGGTPWAAIRRVLPLASVVPVMLLWAARTAANPLTRRVTEWDLNWLTTRAEYYASTASWTTPGGWGWGRTAGLFPRLLGTLPGLLPTLIGIAVFLLPVAAGMRFSRDRRTWIPFVLCAALLLFVPGVLFGNDFTFQRFTVFALPLFLITLEQPAGRTLPRWTWPACALLISGWIAIVGMNAVRYEREASGFDAVLTRMKPGERALSLVFERDSAGTIAPAFLHFPSWYAAVKGGVVDPSMAGTYIQLVLYRPGAEPMARLLGFEWSPVIFDWRRFGGSDYRYFVARAPSDIGAWLFKDSPCGGTLVLHTNHWWLYERRDCAATGASGTER